MINTILCLWLHVYIYNLFHFNATTASELKKKVPTLQFEKPRYREAKETRGLETELEREPGSHGSKPTVLPLDTLPFSICMRESTAPCPYSMETMGGRERMRVPQTS